MKQVIDNKKKKSLPKGIRHLASGKFIADVCINGKRKTKTVDTLEEAIIERQKMLQQYRDSTASDASASTAAGNDADLCTLDMLFKRTYNLYWKDTSWGKIAKYHYKQLSTFLGGGDHLSVTSLINLNTLDSFVDYLIDQGNSNSTINRKLAILSKMLTTAVDRGIIEKVVKIPRRKEALHRIRFLTTEEENKMVQTLSMLGYKPQLDAFLVLLYTGFRSSELWRLQVRDVDLKHGTITAWKTKNGYPRTIPIVNKIRPIIERLTLEATDRGDDNLRLFPRGTNIWFETAWRKAKILLGLSDDPQFIPYALRHTCASRLAQAGVSMMVIKEWLGHRNIATTTRYTHLAPKDLRNAAQVLSS